MKFYRFIKTYLSYQVGVCIGVRNIGTLLEEGFVEEVQRAVFDDFLRSLIPKTEIEIEPCEDCEDCEDCGECEDCKSKTPEEVLPTEEVTAKPKKK